MPKLEPQPQPAAACGFSTLNAAPPITVDPSASVLEALELMTVRRIRHLPVLEDGRLTAFISIGDLVKYRIEMIEYEAQVMREYIRMA